VAETQPLTPVAHGTSPSDAWCQDRCTGGAYGEETSTTETNTEKADRAQALARASFEKALREGAEAMLPPERVMEGVTIAIVRAPGGVPIGFSGP